MNKSHPLSLHLLKKKLYNSLILFFGLGIAFAPTLLHAKPAKPAKSAHAKHINTPIKPVKKTSTTKSNKKLKTPAVSISKASHKHTLAKSKSIHSVRHVINKKPSYRSAHNTYAKQHIQEASFIEPTTNNERIHTLIDTYHNDNPVVSSTQTHSDNYAHTDTPPHINSAHGIVSSSLTTAGEDAGLTPELIEQLTNIFAWDIDFATNLNQGDQFTVIYEEGNDGTRGSQIVAAEFVNRGRILTALKYTNSEGNSNFYSPEGKPMRKAFLSAPVDYLRISSGFSSHRKHPILNRIRAHKGIDYAARTGTPVKSAGDGEIAFLGNKGAYGQILIVKHGEHYETVYAHLSNFKKDLASGDQVKQGEIIGYVGQTGLATGPHLHYEFRVDGAHQNPETLNMAQTLPLHDIVLADFKTQTRTTLDQLNKTKAQSLFAKNQFHYN